MDFRFYHTIFLDFIVILFRPCYLLSAAIQQFVGGAIQIFFIDWLIDWTIGLNHNSPGEQSHDTIAGEGHAVNCRWKHLYKCFLTLLFLFQIL